MSSSLASRRPSASKARLGCAAGWLLAGALSTAAVAQAPLSAATGAPAVTAGALPPGAQRFESPGTRGRLVVALLPGQSGDAAAIAAATTTATELARQLQATVVMLPGPLQGASSPPDAPSLDRTAAALRQVRDAYPGRKLLLAGLGEGAAQAALLAGREPRSADAVLLAACACDGAVAASAAGMRPEARIAVVVGTRDDRTPPPLSERYVTALQARGVKTRLTYAINATHVSVQRSPEFFMLANTLADDLLR